MSQDGMHIFIAPSLRVHLALRNDFTDSVNQGLPGLGAIATHLERNQTTSEVPITWYCKLINTLSSQMHNVSNIVLFLMLKIPVKEHATYALPGNAQWQTLQQPGTEARGSYQHSVKSTTQDPSVMTSQQTPSLRPHRPQASPVAQDILLGLTT